MTESFAQLFEEFLNETEFQQGSIVKGTVVAIENGFVLVDAGLKSESAIPAEQFKNAAGELEVEVGAEVDVALDAVEDGFGETQLSREKAKRHEAWIVLEKACEEAETVVGIINGKVKGGFTVELNGIRAFLPGSLVDVRPIRDTAHLENKELEFKVIKLDQKRNNVVVSRRAVIEQESLAIAAEQQAALEAASIEQSYSQQLEAYILQKQEQAEQLEDKLELLLDQQQSRLQKIQNAKPGFIAMPSSRAAWQEQVTKQQSVLNRIQGRLEVVRELKDGMGIHSPRVEELAARKLRQEQPELAEEYDEMRQAQRAHSHRERLEKEKELAKRQSVGQSLSRTRD